VELFQLVVLEVQAVAEEEIHFKEVLNLVEQVFNHNNLVNHQHMDLELQVAQDHQTMARQKVAAVVVQEVEVNLLLIPQLLVMVVLEEHIQFQVRQ
jgi:hypothetical protein